MRKVAQCPPCAREGWAPYTLGPQLLSGTATAATTTPFRTQEAIIAQPVRLRMYIVFVLAIAGKKAFVRRISKLRQ